MAKHYIVTGNGCISVGSYLTVVRELKRLSACGQGNKTTAVNFNGWGPVTVDHALRQVREAIHHSINRNAHEEWRNTETIEEIDEHRDARDLHNWLQNRMICRRLRSPRLQKRFGHLLFRDE